MKNGDALDRALREGGYSWDELFSGLEIDVRMRNLLARKRGRAEVIEVPDGTRDAEPLTFDAHPRGGVAVRRVVVGAGASVRLQEQSGCGGCGSKGAVCATLLILKEGASADFVSVRGCAAKSRQESVFIAKLGRGAHLDFSECRFGGAGVRSDAYVALVGDGASADLRSLFFAADDDRHDARRTVRHFASGTSSNIISRGALAGSAKASYHGLIEVDRGTAGCAGYQKAETLMLSRQARMECAPDLRIGAHDVRCGHGMTVSSLDSRKLFYMMSRGMTQEQAKRAAAIGFMGSVLARLPESVKQTALETLASRLDCALEIS